MTSVFVTPFFYKQLFYKNIFGWNSLKVKPDAKQHLQAENEKISKMDKKGYFVLLLDENKQQSGKNEAVFSRF